MSQSDSFIDEVTEEVRRERLYGTLRRYGWIGVVAVLLIVGGAAFYEYRAAQDRAEAEARGDAILAALAQDDSAARAEALQQLGTDSAAVAATALLTAAAQVEAGEADAAKATLDALATNGEVPAIYADLAAFRSALLDVGDPDGRRAALEALSSPGAPFALLAQEQLALMDLTAGETDAALARLQSIVEDAGVSQGLRERAQTLMVALGAGPDDGTAAAAPAGAQD